MATASTPLMSFTSPLGPDVLRFRSLSAYEELGRLFEFNVVVLSDPKTDVDPTALLGQPAAVHIESADGAKRHFHGLVVRAGLESAQGKLVSWRLQLRPWLWQLTRRTNSRIFQNLGVIDIIKKVFEHYKNDVRFSTTGTYSPRIYCVQYRETDFNFVSRLMEEEGIYYYFEHAEGKHTLVVCDASSAHSDAPGFSNILFRESQDQLLDLQAITDWRHAHELSTGKVELTDYDWLKPSTSLLANHSSIVETSPAKLEQFDYPGLYTEKNRGTALAKVRMQEVEARVLRVSGASDTVRGLSTGFTFTLKEHPLASENVAHLVVSTRIDLQYSGYESGQGESHFSCRFSAIRNATQFRPDRATPRPVVPGPQTAVVVGPSGEEIYTDEHGRIKVQFHWDREGKKNENSSCWVRVATRWAGKAWGMISIPRIGQEVVVDFLEGDPDLPLVTGAVYNAEQVTPYKLPDHKTVSTIKSRSSKQGANDNFNELAFEDLKGEEWIRLHAEKDYLEVVKHDAHRDVGNDQFLKVVRNLTEEVGGNIDRKVKGKITQKIDQTVEYDVAQQSKVKVGGKMHVNTNDDLTVKSGGDFSLDATGAGHMKFGTNLGVKAVNVHIKADANIVLEAGAMFTIKAPMINIEASGIVSINGSLTKINSGGGGGSGGGCSPKSPDAPGVPEVIKPLVDKFKKVKDDLAKGR